MASNIFIFHGAGGYPTENWFPWLKEKLEAKGHQIFVPQFPSPPQQPAKITEWFDVLKNYNHSITEDAILIGHSVGGIFTLRVLERLTHSIKAVFLVGTPIGIKPILEYDQDKSFSGFSFDWKIIRKNSKNFIVYHSDNDPYVSLANGEQLAKELGVSFTFIPQAGHFNAKAGYTIFPDLLAKVEEILTRS